MSYIVPACNGISFDITSAYIIPAECTSLLFIIGGDVYPDIISADSEILIFADDMELTTAHLIEIANAEINIQAEVHDFEWMAEFVSADAEINLEFPLSQLRILPDIIVGNSEISIDTTDSIIRSTGEEHLPSGVSTEKGRGMYRDGSVVDIHKSLIIKIGIKTDDSISISSKEAEHPDHSTKIVWGQLYLKDNSISVPCNRFHIFADHSIKSPWSVFEYADNLSAINYGSNFENIDDSFKTSYMSPYPNDVLKDTIWESSSSPINIDFYTPYNAPKSNDVDKSIEWGPLSYYTLCEGKYVPPKCIATFKFPSKYELVANICEGIRFELNEYSSDPRCMYDHWHTGMRDSGSGILIGPRLKYPKPKEVYYMLNYVLVEEVVTGTPIEVLHVNAKIDRNSWLWSFNITVADKCYLDLLKTVDGVMGHVKINMNGYIWYCTVEGWSENRSFGTQAWTITGRSPAMMFGSPISQKSNGVIAIDKQGQTIFEEIVEAKQLPQYWPAQFNLWTSDFLDYTVTGKVVTGFRPYQNWLIPENTVSYSEKTEIEILKDLAASIGAYIQADPENNVLKVKPLYAHQPWNWTVGNIDIIWKTMNESELIEVARTNELKPYYQAVHVIGESIGASNDGTSADVTNTAIFTDVRRNEWNTATASYAPMITDQYITSTKVALEIGRMVIAQTGEWIKHTLRIGTLCADGTGLFETGDMISVMERSTAWYGQVTGVSVVAANAGAGFAIEQTIEVEEYLGE